VSRSGVVMYTTVWCGYCVRLKRQLEREGVPFTEVDIEGDGEAEAVVRGANAGNATVPTLRFPDGTTLTNPSLRQVTERLRDIA
jgi:mycoredoxin